MIREDMNQGCGENEDEIYCKTPNHISYYGQKVLHTRFEWQRKILERKLNNRTLWGSKNSH
jgi:hypothetical protein